MERAREGNRAIRQKAIGNAAELGYGTNLLYLLLSSLGEHVGDPARESWNDQPRACEN